MSSPQLNLRDLYAAREALVWDLISSNAGYLGLIPQPFRGLWRRWNEPELEALRNELAAQAEYLALPPFRNDLDAGDVVAERMAMDDFDRDEFMDRDEGYEPFDDGAAGMWDRDSDETERSPLDDPERMISLLRESAPRQMLIDTVAPRLHALSGRNVQEDEIRLARLNELEQQIVDREIDLLDQLVQDFDERTEAQHLVAPDEIFSRFLGEIGQQDLEGDVIRTLGLIAASRHLTGVTTQPIAHWPLSIDLATAELTDSMLTDLFSVVAEHELTARIEDRDGIIQRGLRDRLASMPTPERLLGLERQIAFANDTHDGDTESPTSIRLENERDAWLRQNPEAQRYLEIARRIEALYEHDQQVAQDAPERIWDLVRIMENAEATYQERSSEGAAALAALEARGQYVDILHDIDSAPDLLRPRELPLDEGNEPVGPVEVLGGVATPSNSRDLIALLHRREAIRNRLLSIDPRYLGAPGMQSPPTGLFNQWSTNPKIQEFLRTLSADNPPIKRPVQDKPLDSIYWLVRYLQEYPDLHQELIESSMATPALAFSGPRVVEAQEQLDALRRIDTDIAKIEYQVFVSLVSAHAETFRRPGVPLDHDFDAGAEHALDTYLNGVSLNDIEGDAVRTLGLIGLVAHLSGEQNQTGVIGLQAPEDPLATEVGERSLVQLFTIFEDRGVSWQVAGRDMLIASLYRHRLSMLPPDRMVLDHHTRLDELAGGENRFRQPDTPDIEEVLFASESSKLPPDNEEDVRAYLRSTAHVQFLEHVRRSPIAQQVLKMIDTVTDLHNTARDESAHTAMTIYREAVDRYNERHRAVLEGRLPAHVLEMRLDPAELLETHKSIIPDDPGDFGDPGASRGVPDPTPDPRDLPGGPGNAPSPSDVPQRPDPRPPVRDARSQIRGTDGPSRLMRDRGRGRPGRGPGGRGL